MLRLRNSPNNFVSGFVKLLCRLLPISAVSLHLPTSVYWAIVKECPNETEGELVHYLVRNEKQNKSYAYDKEVKNSKKAVLHYKLIGHSQNYYLLEVDLKTGRHHQIRCQLAKMGCPIKGDLKYGFPRSNPDGSICLHARTVQFVHPVSKEMIQLTAPVPEGNLWNGFEMD